MSFKTTFWVPIFYYSRPVLFDPYIRVLLGNGNTSDSFITIPDVEIVDVFNNNLDKYNLKLNKIQIHYISYKNENDDNYLKKWYKIYKNMDNTIYEVYRIYSVDDEYIETLLIYNGNYQNSNNFIKDYLSKLNNIFISLYYDRIYIVKNKEELEYIDDYIDVKYYKNKIN